MDVIIVIQMKKVSTMVVLHTIWNRDRERNANGENVGRFLLLFLVWGSFEVFFDTMIVCTITALSVLLNGNWTDGTNGGTLALSSFATGFGTVGSVLLAIIMVIFTVTTSGGWFTYYLAILEHLYKKEGRTKDIVMKIFYGVRALPGVLWTIYLVKTNNQGFIWTVVDITSAIPTFVNVAVL